MILVLLGVFGCYGALVSSALITKSEDIWLPQPTAGAAVLTLGLVPLLATWAGLEVMRAARRPKVLTRHSHPLKRLLLGLATGLLGIAAGALAVVLLEPVNGGYAWLMMGGCAFLSPTVTLALARRLARGHCPRCDYDLAGATVASRGKCPECGLDQMAVSLGT